MMNRAIMILKYALDWNETQIKNADNAIKEGRKGQKLLEYKQVINDNIQHNIEIEQALKKLMYIKPA